MTTDPKSATPGGATGSTTGGPSITGGQFDKSPLIFGGQNQMNIADTINQNITQTEELAYQVSGECPYLGLLSYEYEHHQRYAGRERSVAEAVSKLAEGDRRTLLFVTGVSGSGKSSFAKAGVLPALEQYYAKEYGQDAVRVRHVVFRPGADPLGQLTAALRKLTNNPDLDRLATPEAIVECLRTSTTRADPSQPWLANLLVIDQFEELFTQSDPTARGIVFAFLEQLPPFKEIHTHIIATLRKDFLPELFDHRQLNQVQKEGVELHKMEAQELQSAIAAPLRAWLREQGLPAESKRFEPALLEKLAADAAADASYLPLLQVTLQELWRGGSLRLGAYITKDAIEPLVRAFQQWANAALAYADYATAKQQPRPQADQDTILQILVDLVKVSDDDDPRRDVRSRQTVLGLQQGSADRERLIHDLIAARLLTSPAEDGTVDIIHEALIRTWDPLRAEIQRQRRLLRQRRRFEEDLQLWRSAPDEDKHDYLLTGVRLEGALELDPNDVAMLGDDARALLANSLEWRARAQRERFMPAVVQSLSAQALRQQAGFFNDEAAALLARQAYLFGQTTNSPVQDQTDDVLRTVLNKPYFSLTWERDPALALAYSSDGRWLAAGGYRSIALLDRRQPNADPIELFREDQQDASIEALAFSPDGRTLAVGGIDNQVWLWDMQQLDAECRVLSANATADQPAASSPDASATSPVAVQALAFSPDGRTLASAGDDKTIRLWKLRSPKAAPRLLSGHEAGIEALAFSPDGRLLASGGDDKTIRLWDLSAPDVAPRMLAGHEQSVEALAFSPDGQALVSCGYDRTLRLWDLQNLDQESLRIFSYNTPVQTLAFSPDGSLLAAGSDDNIVRLWDCGQLDAAPTVLQGHRSAVLTLAFSPDGQTLASGARNEPVRLWDMRPSGSDAIVVPGFGIRANSVAISSDGRRLAAGTYQDAGLWDLERLDAPTILSEHVGVILAVAFSPDGQGLVAGDERSLRFWDLSQPTPTLAGVFETESAFEAIAFSPDQKLLAAGNRDTLVRVWKLDQSEQAIELAGHEGAIKAVVFSLDSRKLASCAEDSTIRVWDLQAPDAAPLVLAADEATALALAFSPDGRKLAAACIERTVALWDLEQPAAGPRLLRGHEAGIEALAFSPDGRLLASGGDDTTVRLWDLENHAARTVLVGHKSRVVRLTFSDDSATLTSCDDGLHLHRWPVYTSAVADQICARVSRNLTYDEWQRFVGKDIPYERTCPGQPVHPSVRYAARRMAAANFADAAGLLRRVAELDPTLELNPEAEAHEAAANAIAGSGRLADVLAHLDASRAAAPGRDLAFQADILLRTGLACASFGLADDAVQAFQAAQALRPDAEIPAEAWKQLAAHLADVATRMAAENFAGALALLRRVAELAPTLELNPEAEAHEAAAVTLAESGRLADVLMHLEAARAAASQRDLGAQRNILLRTELVLMRDGQVADAVKALDAAQAVQPDVPLETTELIWLCWVGSLAGHADLVLAAGDRAVAIAPENGESYDARGLARALTGDIPGAIEDFNAFLKWAKGNDDLADRVALRKQFVAALRKGRNPFDEATIAQLRRE